MSKKVLIMLIKSMFLNFNFDTNSHQSSPLLFHQGEFSIGSYLKIKFGWDSTKSMVTLLLLVRGIFYII